PILSARPAAKVLDFGCGVGRILGHLITRHRCHGVEVNPRATAVAKLKGITILSESDLSSGKEGGFDFVILSDVFEHLPNPLEFLRTLTGVLGPRGELIVSTGNGDAVRCQKYLSHFWYFRSLGHLQMLSPKQLHLCAEQLDMMRIESRIP